MFDDTTLKAIHCYKSFEQDISHNYSFDRKVVILKSVDGSYRFCYKRALDQGIRAFDSCLIVSSSNTITSVYTVPSKRRQKIAKQLLLVARLTLGSVYHNDHLTVSGKLWRDSVENLK
jgi:hypothetical protein